MFEIFIGILLRELGSIMVLDIHIEVNPISNLSLTKLLMLRKRLEHDWREWQGNNAY